MRSLCLFGFVALLVLISGLNRVNAGQYDACNATNTACRQACYAADKGNANYNVEGCLGGCASAQSNCVGGFAGPKGSRLKKEQSEGAPSGGRPKAAQ
jgi:hypothetical protein